LPFANPTRLLTRRKPGNRVSPEFVPIISTHEYHVRDIDVPTHLHIVYVQNSYNILYCGRILYAQTRYRPSQASRRAFCIIYNIVMASSSLHPTFDSNSLFFFLRFTLFSRRYKRHTHAITINTHSNRTCPSVECSIWCRNDVIGSVCVCLLFNWKQ